MVKVEHAVIAVRQLKSARLAPPAELSDIFHLPLFPSFRAEPVKAFFTQAHDSILVAGLSIKLGDGLLLMAG